MVGDVERQKQILELRFAGLTYAQIATHLGVSRQRVHQLISPPSKVRNRIVKQANGLCQMCGLCVNGSGHVHHLSCDGEDYNDVDNLQLLCVSCHRNIHARACIVTYCAICGKIKNNWRTYCSTECWQHDHRVELICDGCGKHFYRIKSDADQRYKYDYLVKHEINRTNKYFCSKKCQGKWLGQHYGRGMPKATPAKAVSEIQEGAV